MAALLSVLALISRTGQQVTATVPNTGLRCCELREGNGGGTRQAFTHLHRRPSSRRLEQVSSRPLLADEDGNGLRLRDGHSGEQEADDTEWYQMRRARTQPLSLIFIVELEASLTSRVPFGASLGPRVNGRESGHCFEHRA